MSWAEGQIDYRLRLSTGFSAHLLREMERIEKNLKPPKKWGWMFLVFLVDGYLFGFRSRAFPG